MTVDKPSFKLGDWIVFDPPREHWTTLGKPSLVPRMVVDFDPDKAYMTVACLHPGSGNPVEYVTHRMGWRLRR